MPSINYVGVLEYLKKYYGLSYKNPDTKGLTDEEKNNFLLIKKIGIEVIYLKEENGEYSVIEK